MLPEARDLVHRGLLLIRAMQGLVLGMPRSTPAGFRSESCHAYRGVLCRSTLLPACGRPPEGGSCLPYSTGTGLRTACAVCAVRASPRACVRVRLDGILGFLARTPFVPRCSEVVFRAVQVPFVLMLCSVVACSTLREPDAVRALYHCTRMNSSTGAYVAEAVGHDVRRIKLMFVVELLPTKGKCSEGTCLLFMDLALAALGIAVFLASDGMLRTGGVA